MYQESGHNVPEDLKFTKEHEWARVEGKEVVVGITDHAQEKLGEIIHIELPEEGERVKKDEIFGVVESNKAASDLFAPLSGEVIEVNEPLLDSPEVINDDPYEEGWMIRIRPRSLSELDDLMDAKEYLKYLAESEEGSGD